MPSPPMPSPPINRAASSTGQLHANPEPRAESTYKTAITRSVSRPPNFCPIAPADIAPITVPTSAMATVSPSCEGVKPYTWVN